MDRSTCVTKERDKFWDSDPNMHEKLYIARIQGQQRSSQQINRTKTCIKLIVHSERKKEKKETEARRK